jgi:two-component system LytT family response regulator
VVDDEPLARDGVKLLIERDPDVELIGECGNGADAVRAIQRLSPDLVFLDIQMPEMNGFDVVAALEPDALPQIVFVTAYDQYALRAFDVHALDYLLKPYDDDRFYAALDRAKRQTRLSEVSALSERLRALLSSRAPAPAPAPASARNRRIAIKSAGRVVFLDMNEIDWIEAADYYVELHAGDKTYLHRQTMASLERELDPDTFVRIHRSAIVNRHRIRELRSLGRRDTAVVLDGGVELKVARSCRDKLQSLL